jgi:hypothetical protein
MRTKVCFIGGARYSQPLDATNEKKWRLLSELGEMFVIGFSQDLRPRRFTQHAHFYLFPKFPLPVLRYLAMFTVGPALAIWLLCSMMCESCRLRTFVETPVLSHQVQAAMFRLCE